MRRFGLVLILAWPWLAAVPAAGLEVPFLSARINDYAAILKPETIRELEGLLKDHEARTTNQIAVLTIRSLEGENLETFSHKTAGAWGLGQKGKDNGVLILVAKDDRKMRIEVGYGLEPRLTDGRCGRIIRDQMTPKFRNGDFDAGVAAGVRAVLTAAEGSAEPASLETVWEWWEELPFVRRLGAVLGGVMSVLGYLIVGSILLLIAAGIFAFIAYLTTMAAGPPGTFFAVLLFFSVGWLICLALEIRWLSILVVLHVFGYCGLGAVAIEIRERGKPRRKRLNWLEKLAFKPPSYFSLGTPGGRGTSGSGRSSGSSYSSSSSGGGYSGGGGSFGGGGASGSW